jgi:hypothetical protein
MGLVTLFPELLGKQSPVVSPDSITNIVDPEAQVRALPLLVEEVEGLFTSIRSPIWRRFSVEWAVSRALLDVCAQAIVHGMSIVIYPEWPEIHDVTPPSFSTMAIRGFHRIRAAHIVDDGALVEVKFVNQQTCLIRAEGAFPHRAGALIARANVGRHSATISLSETGGDTVQLTPHAILHLCDPDFRDE